MPAGRLVSLFWDKYKNVKEGVPENTDTSSEARELTARFSSISVESPLKILVGKDASILLLRTSVCNTENPAKVPSGSVVVDLGSKPSQLIDVTSEEIQGPGPRPVQTHAEQMAKEAVPDDEGEVVVEGEAEIDAEFEAEALADPVSDNDGVTLPEAVGDSDVDALSDAVLEAEGEELVELVSEAD